MTFAASVGTAAKRRVLASVSTTALLTALVIAPAQAQTAPAQPQAQDEETSIDEIVVTGSRIVRDGFQAPTPVSVMSAEEIARISPTHVMDMVTQLPTLAGSTTPQTGHTGVSAGVAGISTINLRNMSASRTLVLWDGRRVVPATLGGSPDVNQFPDNLIQRVDVVTGGASAAYGSDAVAGVVNFVLDKDFTGVKGDITGSITHYGDGERIKTALTFGTPFAGGRGHFLAAMDYANNAMIKGQTDIYPESRALQDREFVRPWYAQGQFARVINNPAWTATGPGAALPRQLAVDGANIATGSAGFLVTSGPLKGLIFDEGGTQRQFNYGLVSGNLMVGGERNIMGDYQSLDAYLGRYMGFLRASYDISDNVNVWAEYSHSFSHTRTTCCAHFNLNQITIQRDNAFLPQNVVDRMIAAGVTVLSGGTFNRDLGPISTEGERGGRVYSFGIDGAFDAAGAEWTWNAYAQRGISRTANHVYQYLRPNYFAAIDAVRNPATGQIVCRSVLNNNPAPFQDPGCVPLNVVGWGVASEEAKRYVLGTSSIWQRFVQDVAAISFAGDPFDTWAGPVSVAVGGEYRKEGIRSHDPSVNPQGVADQWFAANFKPTNGAYNVKEAFLETVVPLAANEAWAQSLELQGAVRATDYSTSGYVTTWKLGASWTPIDDIRFRVTRSRDIRAGSLNDLFLAGQVNTQTVRDPFRNNEEVIILRPQVGNPTLSPEKANTTGIGVVISPSFVPGFTASFDYYNIAMKDRIAVLQNQEVADRCFAGNTALCSQIERNAAGQIFRLTVRPTNYVRSTDRGFDFEAAYRFDLAQISEGTDGNVTLRLLATRLIESTTFDGTTLSDDTGESGNRRWRLRGQVSFDFDPLSFSVVGRYISKGVLDGNWVECQSGCPASVAPFLTIDNNTTPSAFYMSLSTQYKWRPTEGTELEFFANVDNLWNRDAGIVYAGGALNFINNGTIPEAYDTLGRTYRAGLRFRM
ncbi:MAG: TonB-dependent receptor plug domain-containing protein [Rhodospirillaceae bacterium]